MCELWVHFLGTSWYIPYFNLDPHFEENYSIAVWTVSSFLWELHGTFLTLIWTPILRKITHWSVNCEFIFWGTSWYISLLQFCPTFWGKFRGVSYCMDFWVSSLGTSWNMSHFNCYWLELWTHHKGRRAIMYAMSCLFEERLDLCLKNPPHLFTGKSFIFVSRNFTFIQWTSFLFDSRKLTCTYSLEKGSSLFDKMSPHLAPTNTKNLWMKTRLWLIGFVSMGYQNCRSSFHPASSHVQA